MKIRYLKFKNWLLTLAAAAMGIQFGSCAVEYGTPVATYHVNLWQIVGCFINFKKKNDFELQNHFLILIY